jgi:cation transport protein ChaC
LHHIFKSASGRYGSTLDYARQTWHCLTNAGIHDAHLHRMLRHAPPSGPTGRADP